MYVQRMFLTKRRASFLSRSYKIWTTRGENDTSSPQFVVGTENGFLPRKDPIAHLPSKFDALEKILNDMPLTLPSGKAGLLASNSLGPTVDSSLPNYAEHIKGIDDNALLTALFRDYTFLASAYLLEPCDLEFKKSGSYGLGRSILPKQIAVPLSIVSDKIGAKPFMEYAQSYSLYNWRRVDPKGLIEYKNLKIIRGFTGMASESAFILVHVAMVAHSGKLVKAIDDCLNAVQANKRSDFNEGMVKMLEALKLINQVMETMWQHSLTGDYVNFRTFIFGILNQPMFPNGVIYEGVSDTPRAYRGESGANDSIIPTLDNFLQLTEKLPSNPLTEILKDFRSYRPIQQNEYLSYVEQTAKSLKVYDYALQDAKSSSLYMALLDQNREFRARHWKFTKEYIIKNTTHAVATGGSPIITWLPNQLSAVLIAMNDTYDNMKKEFLGSDDRSQVEVLRQRANTQLEQLKKEVAAFLPNFENQIQ